MNITNCQLLLPCLRRFCLMKKFFPFKILEKLCFFNFFMLEFNIFSNKIPRKKHSHLSNGSRLISQTVHFYSPATSFLFDEKFVSFSKFLQNFVFFNFFTFEFKIFNKKITKNKHSHFSNGSR